MEDVTKRFDSGRVLFKDLNLTFYHGAKIGILGVNGAGKSSLLKVIGGLDDEYEGEARPLNNRVVGYLAQEPKFDSSKSVRECVLEGLKDKLDLMARFDEISAKFGEELEADEMDRLIEEQGEVQALIDQYDCWDLNYKVDVAMDALRCPPADASLDHLSGGEKRRVALCRLLLSEPDILLLDEPTNHLDNESVYWLERYLDAYKGLVVAITHDRYFLDNVAGFILEIDGGQCFPFRGNYTAWLEHKAHREALQQRAAKVLDKKYESELKWLRSGQKGGRATGKSRVKQISEMAAEREEKLLARKNEGGSIIIPEGPRLGDGVVILCDHVSHSVDRKPLFKDLTFRLFKGQVVGIVGPNGCGKTTLLKLMTAKVKPDKGEVTLGKTVTFAYNEQMRDELDEDNSVWHEIAGKDEEIVINSSMTMRPRQYVAQFNFGGQAQLKKIHQLSGGERNRVHLAKSLKRGCNVLILDEPTNDLDVDTLRKLEEGLNDFRDIGCGIVVSHDRWFLDRVCTHILSLDPANPDYQLFEGNYTEFEADRKSKSPKKKEAKFKNIKLN